MHAFNSQVGMGSNLHDFGGSDLMRRLTWLSETGSNSEKLESSEVLDCEGLGKQSEAESLKEETIVLILPSKNSPNSLDRTSSER